MTAVVDLPGCQRSSAAARKPPLLPPPECDAGTLTPSAVFALLVALSVFDPTTLMLRSPNVAMYRDVIDRVVAPSNGPVPLANVITTEAEHVVAQCNPHPHRHSRCDTPRAVPVGCCTNVTVFTGPAVMLNAAAHNHLASTRSNRGQCVPVLALSIDRPLKVAWLQHWRDHRHRRRRLAKAATGIAPSRIATGYVCAVPVTVLPMASCSVTTALKPTPAVLLLGLVVKASFAAGPMTEKLAETLLLHCAILGGHHCVHSGRAEGR